MYPLKVLFYLVMVICSSASFVYFCIDGQLGSFIPFDMIIFVLANLYFVLLIILELKKKESSAMDEGLLIDNSNKFVDSLPKYIYPIVIGYLFMTYCLVRIIIWFKTSSSVVIKVDLYYIIFSYVYCIFPVCCVVDMFITKRTRSINLILDLAIIAIAITALYVLEFFIYQIYFKGLLGIGDYLSKRWYFILFSYGFSLLEFILYYFITFKRNGLGSYSLLKTDAN